METSKNFAATFGANQRLLNHIVALLCLCLWFVPMNAQQQTYTNKSEGVSFTYPSSFSKSPIQSAKHMLLKLEKGNQTIALSKWNYGIDSSYTIWDDEIAQMTMDNIKRSGVTLVSFDKRYIATASGNKKCLVNVTKNGRLNLHMVTYQFLHKGNLVQVIVTNKGEFSKSLLAKYDGYLKGLKLN